MTQDIPVKLTLAATILLLAGFAVTRSFADGKGMQPADLAEEDDATFQAQSKPRGWKIPFDGSESAPLIVEDILYIGSLDGAVYAINARTGQKIWRFQTGEGLTSGPEIITVPSNKLEDMFAAAVQSQRGNKGKREIRATPLVENGTVYIGSLDHKFYALDASTGQLKWAFDAGEAVENAILEDGRLYFPSGTFIYSLDAKSGKQIWSFEFLKEMQPLSKHPLRMPILKDGTLYVTTWYDPQPNVPPTSDLFTGSSYKSYLVAIDAETGERKWDLTIDGHRPSAPQFSDALIFFSNTTRGLSENVKLYAVDTSTSKVKWEFEAENPDTFSRLVVGNGLVYLATETALFALEQTTGKIGWRWEAKAKISSYSMRLDQFLFVRESMWKRRPKLFALDPITGKKQWSARSGYIDSIIDGVLYAPDGTKLIALDSQSGKKLWTFKTGGVFREGTRLSSGPVLHKGRLYFPTATAMFFGKDSIQGHLYSIDAKSGKLK